MEKRMRTKGNMRFDTVTPYLWSVCEMRSMDLLWSIRRVGNGMEWNG